MSLDLIGSCWSNQWTDTYHGCSSCCLVDLVLGGFDFGLQVSRRVKVLALLPRAAALYVVHAHSDCVVVGVNHSAICWVGKATVILPTCTVAPLVFTAYLGHKHNGETLITNSIQTCSHKGTQMPDSDTHYEVTVHIWWSTQSVLSFQNLTVTTPDRTN